MGIQFFASLAGIIISDDQDKTHKLVSSITHIIEELKIEHKKSKVSDYLTVSVGIATICHTMDSDIDKLYSSADKALYKAKEGGRKRTELTTLCH